MKFASQDIFENLDNCFSGIVRRVHYSMEYESCLEYFLRLRLYEGFILRDLKVLKKGGDQSIFVELILPWKQQVTIGYKICALCEDHSKRFV